MKNIEMVQVRLFNVKDGAQVIEAFNRVFKNPPPSRAGLYQSANVANDWSVIFLESDADAINLKSPEALCLVEYLRPIGLVNYALWGLVPAASEDGPDQSGFQIDSPRKNRRCPAGLASDENG